MGEYALILVLALAAEPAQWEDVAVVRPAGWSAAIETWKRYRLGQSMRVHEIDAEVGTENIVRSIKELGQQPNVRLGYVLLAGDVADDVDPRSQTANSLVPTCYLPSSAMVRFGSEPHIASDNPFADLDGDHIPDISIGRIPADNANQLALILDRTIAFENNMDFSAWRRNVHVVAGVGGFGAIVDSMIEMTTRRFLTDRIPSWAELTMTHASPGSPYCPDPFRFGQCAIDRLNQGGAFWVYVGHGHVETLDKVQVNDQLLDIMTKENVQQINCSQFPPVAVFLACYTGAFDASRDCLAEQILKSNSGPVATLAASRMTGPYGMALLSSGMLAACYDDQNPRLGKIVLHAKREMLMENRGEQKQTPERNRAQMELIDSLAKALSPAGHDLEQERLEHVWEMNLLGDPTLRLSHPESLAINIPERLQPGATIDIQGIAPIQGRLRLELVLRRDALPQGLNPIKHFSTDENARQQMQRCYIQANSRVITSAQHIVPEGPFKLPLDTPAELPGGRYLVRAFLEGAKGWAAGDAQLAIRKTPNP